MFQDQYQQSVCPDLSGYGLFDTLIVFLKDNLTSLILKKRSADDNKRIKLSSLQRVTSCQLIEIVHDSTCVFVL